MVETFDEPNIEAESGVLPAYEYQKRNILFSWFRIESEFERYILYKSTGKNYRIENITSKILGIYTTTLKPMMKKRKGYEQLIEELDYYTYNNGFKIPEDKIYMVIENIAMFLHEMGLTNISFEKKPWQDSLKDSYGVF